jgi:hypothetical protein
MATSGIIIKVGFFSTAEAAEEVAEALFIMSSVNSGCVPPENPQAREPGRVE